ncbi:MAG TPA: DUF1801 domain-containing protein [Terriglobales bacterium]
MKKAPASKRKLVRKSGGKTIDEYVASVPKDTRPAFDRLRATVKSAVPKDATETISYGIPAFKGKKVLVWYAAFAKHCSLFPSAAVIAQFKDELEGYTISKGTVQFPLDKPLPTALIKKMVKARVAQA